MSKFFLIKLLKNPLYLAAGFAAALILFSFNYYLMATLPGSDNFQCKIGAGLTTWNISFAALLSLMTGWLVMGLMALSKHKFMTTSASGTALAGFGTFTGIFTSFCTLCALPVISLLGTSIGFGFFTDYNLYFKTLSIILMLIALYLINRSLNRQCTFCHY